MINEGNKIKLDEYRELINQQQLFIKKINVIFKNVDFVISSSTFSEAPLKNSEEKKDISLIWTLSHLLGQHSIYKKK